MDTAIFMSFIGTDSNTPWMSGHLLHIVYFVDFRFHSAKLILPPIISVRYSICAVKKEKTGVEI